MGKKEREPTEVIAFRVPRRVRDRLVQLTARMTIKKKSRQRLTDVMIEAIDRMAKQEKVS